jgi:hypothetical protein
MEIMTRQKDKAILYWFGHPESKTLRPVLWFALLAWRDYMVVVSMEVVWSAGCMALPQEDTLARLILGEGQGPWTGVQVGYNKEIYL